MTTLPTQQPPLSLAKQDPASLGGRLSVLYRQRADHVRLEELLRQLDATPLAKQRPVLLDLYRLVFPHAFAEESVLWPVLRRVLPEGKELTLQVEQEHQEVNEVVSRLEDLDVADPGRGPLLQRLADLLREDVRDEEDELLPGLQQKLTLGQLRRLGLLWEVVRRVSPTRAHPVVARRPPGNVVAALPLTVIDRSRDMLERVALRSAPSIADRLAVLDHRLGRAARRVERLPMMRAGEHASTSVGHAASL
ncbi:hemerythrin domain-containing protein [Ornithinimicrobium pratense]|uniref:Hemerythrin domain-containing protein n=1 Tax=Ornithinimicrobium pratense TaxID=2593973 RepID=A0A5J6V6E5_9MICO|nr:hemerythrin domain-containing protein [Ornithinimicrobium pratense]QFG68696.1 hemerythrin domain-containing protein [Ornithinimicrobium pratense]